MLLIGHAGHEETEGTLGEVPGRITLVQSPREAERVEVADPGQVSYLVQTTLAVDEVTEVLDALRRRFPALTGPSSDDICYATTNRQVALRAIADEADLVLVLGSANSSNSRRLVEVAQRAGTPAHLVDDVGAVDLRWLAGARTVGVTAGCLGTAAPGRPDRGGARRTGRASRPGTYDQHRRCAFHPAKGETSAMSMPLRQSIRVGRYLIGQKLRRKQYFPLLVELEPLFACNLSCAGCGKIQHPADVLKRRMPVEQAIGAVDGVRGADGLHRRRRAADAPADRR